MPLPTQRTLICTFVALASGAFGFLIGGQMSVNAQTQRCQTQPWGLRNICEAWVTPGAAWQGSFTGLWTGMVLGGFAGGLATRKPQQEAPMDAANPSVQANESALQANEPDTTTLGNTGVEVPLSSDLKLTQMQREVLQCLLILLAATSDHQNLPKLPSSSSAHAQILSPELQEWAKVTARSHPLATQNITLAQAKQLLVELGFSERAIEQAWRIVQVGS
ncbi:hypothetical protein [Leptolyngbya sp. FACHB-671]|uniref:hypothetical protein n=1 Tax=Leptolyngbya sp. FACHB-671 TaxID=2692812 RepID=UPI0018EF4B06|nr:hypothetical protein [Leptolyngbya sp. FACHB-671]